MGWNQTRPMGTGANRVGGALGGSEAMPRPKMNPHPPGQNRIGPHPNQRNAATGIRTSTPSKVGFKNRVERKPF